ncbi:MAG: NAD-binding protein, partial [Porphyromonas sp.]|nr:NAD-binding protein [Porphyromonas sp.]
MKIIIAGAGEVGVHLAQMLTHEEQNIVLMDTDAKRLDEVKGSIEALVVAGNPLLIEDQEAAYVPGADLFVAVTPDQSTNMIACSIAKLVGAKHTIARVNNPEYLEAEYSEVCARFGID